MNDSTQPAPQQTTAPEQNPITQLCLTTIDQAIERHGMVNDKGRARGLLLKQARQAGGVVYFKDGDADIDTDTALRKLLPPSIFAIPGAPPADAASMTYEEYAKARRSYDSERLTGLRRVCGSGV